MVTRKILFYFTVILIGQCLSLGCKESSSISLSTECTTGCCFDDSKVEFIRKLENISVDKVGKMYLLLKEPIDENETVLVCPTDWPIFDTLSITYKISGSPPYGAPYEYRLWGTLYENLNIPPGFNPIIKNYFVKIDKIKRK